MSLFDSNCYSVKRFTVMMSRFWHSGGLAFSVQRWFTRKDHQPMTTITIPSRDHARTLAAQQVYALVLARLEAFGRSDATEALVVKEIEIAMIEQERATLAAYLTSVA